MKISIHIIVWLICFGLILGLSSLLYTLFGLPGLCALLLLGGI